MLLPGKGESHLFVRGKHWRLSPPCTFDDAMGCTEAAAGETGDSECRVPEPVVEEATEGDGGLADDIRKENVRGVEPSSESHQGASGNRRGAKRAFEPVRISKRIVTLMEEFLEKNLFVPPDIVTEQVEWTNHEELKFYPPESPETKLALQNFSSKFKSMQFHDYVNFYKTERNCIWRPGVDYWDLDTSVQLASEWLEKNASAGQLQSYENGFKKQQISGKQLLQEISDVVYRQKPKYRCFQFQGTFSTGKTWFVNMITDFHVSVGQMRNWNKWNQFPHQNLVGVRIGVWHEPIYNGEQEQLETFKQILGGENFSVAKKHKADATVYNTPILITTNSSLCNNEVAFGDRRKIFFMENVRFFNGTDQCPGKMALHPAAWYHLILKYEIRINDIIEKPKIRKTNVFSL